MHGLDAQEEPIALVPVEVGDDQTDVDHLVVAGHEAGGLDVDEREQPVVRALGRRQPRRHTALGADHVFRRLADDRCRRAGDGQHGDEKSPHRGEGGASIRALARAYAASWTAPRASRAPVLAATATDTRCSGRIIQNAAPPI